jgi:hypothetical protein
VVSVRDVLAMPELRLRRPTGRPATGPDRALGRRITRIYGTELPDPGRYLSGGELVLSGLLWLRTDADVAPFVRALAGAGVAALIACDADTGVLPPVLVGECARQGVPLLEAAVDLSFALITDRVGVALAGERAGGGRLITALARGAELPELVDLARQERGAPAWVLTPLGRLLAGPELTAAQTAGLVRDFLRHTGRSRVGRIGVALHPVDDAGGVPDLARWFLAAAGDAPVAELLGVAGVARAREREGRRVANRVAGALLDAVRAGSARPAELTATALAAGLNGTDLTGRLRVLTLSVPGAGPGVALPVLEELLAPHGVAAELDGEVFALLPAAAPAPDAAAALRLLEPGLGERRLVLGTGAAESVAGLRAAVAEARNARRLGELRAARTAVVAGDEVAVHRLLLAGVPDELRRTLRRRLLGPVTDYDAEHGSDLLGTLTAFLDRDGSWTRTAAALHVHVNTLRYRIGKVEQLTGRDLGDFAARVDLYLALRIEGG